LNSAFRSAAQQYMIFN